MFRRWQRVLGGVCAIAVLITLAAIPASRASADPVLNAAAQYAIDVPGDVLEASGGTMTEAAQLAAMQKYNWELAESQFSDVSGAFTTTPANPTTVLSSTDAATFTADTATFAMPATEIAGATKVLGGVAEPLLALSIGTMIGAGGARLFGFKDDQVCEQQNTALTVMAGVLDGVDCSAWNDALAAEQRNLDANQAVYPDACVPGVGCWSFTGKVAVNSYFSWDCFSGPLVPVDMLFSTDGPLTTTNEQLTGLGWTSGCGTSPEMEAPELLSAPIVQYQFMNDQSPYNTGDIETVGTTGPNPTRNWVCKISTTTGGVYTRTSDSWTEADTEVAPILCPTMPAGEIAASMMVTEHGGQDDQTVWNADTTTGYQNWARLYPECANGSCPLILDQLDQSCFNVGVACDGWIDDPDRATDYTCKYGTHTIPLSECFVYGPLFNPGNQAGGNVYGDPSNGSTLGTQTSPTKVDDIERGLLNSEWSDSQGAHVGWISQFGYVTAGSMNAAANALANYCVSQADSPGSQITEKDCGLPIFAPGTDISTAAAHDLLAETVGGQPWILHYMTRTAKGDVNSPFYARQGWYSSYDCGPDNFPGVPNGCDEYPFYASQEGGPGADLKMIIQADNGKEGTLLFGLATRCGLTTPTEANKQAEFLVLPLPEVVDLPTMSWCNNAGKQ